ncbi:MAG: hypothetical protein ACFFBZ_12450 [Promethearchaeota archaeon]
MIRKSAVKYFLLSIIIIILMAHFVHHRDLEYAQNTMNSSNELINKSSVETYTVPWLKNSNFSTNEYWSVTKEGDVTDVSANINNGQANYVVIGEERTFSDISGVPLESDWDNVTNPEYPDLPDFYEIDEYGCHASHLWVGPDDPVPSPSIHWERIITMPVNMSDYEITSASVSAVFNASVTTQPGGADYPSDYCGIDTPNDDVPQEYFSDSIRFYMLISDIENTEIHEIAWYQSIDLGQDEPEIANITDSFMNTRVEEDIVIFLKSLFEHDNFQFKITLGMRIFCENNYLYDRDSWDSLRIKNCNLNFIYQKKVDEFTSVSFYQQGNSITGSNVQITNATLNFKYKIDQTWPILLSPNSKIRVLINNNQHTETIKLSSATSIFQEAKLSGFDVTNLIQKNVNISVSIQILMVNTFQLDRNITISIDDVYLIISYAGASGPPQIVINSPNSYQLIGNTASNYDISIMGSYNSIWYTLDGGLTNITVSSLTGTINQAVWDAQADGLVTIIFYASNSIGLVGSSQVHVIKASSEELSFPRIPGYNILILLGMVGIISIVLFRKRFRV